MLKIGIVSYYRNINYGSALQACAMQMAIRKLGYDCEHIRCFIGRNRKQKILALLKNPFLIIKNRITWYCKKVAFLRCSTKYNKFKQFVCDNIKESEVFYKKNDLSQTSSIYDAFVCGSDQIWAPNQFNEWFYIDFISDKYKKIAYAPSIGLPCIPDTLKTKMASLIRDIGYLSIREQEGAQIVYELTGLNIPVVLDPTLLINKEEWLAKIKVSKAPKEPYILSLFLGENPQHRKVVENYGRKKGYKIVTLPFRKLDFKWGDIIKSDAGPLEFIDLVNNAAMVFSDSFHGAAFALNLNRPFGVFMRFSDDHPICQNSRIRNLLNLFSLQTRLVCDAESLDAMDVNIDYQSVNEKLDIERVKSMDYLKNALENSLARGQSRV
jgi:hypothetical protein